MDPAEFLQKAAIVLANLSQDGNLTLAEANNSTASTPHSATIAVSSFLSTLFHLPALTDWLKFFLIGGLIEACRRLLFTAWRSILESFWISATFSADDESYIWIMYWLSRHPKWAKARTIEISTRSFGLTSPGVVVDGDDNSDGNRRLTYLPSLSKTYSLWYKRRYMTVTRERTQESYYRASEIVQIKIFTRDHRVLTELLLETKKTYHAAQEHHISVHAADMSKNWRLVATRPKRPLKSIVLDPGIKDLLLEDAREFLASKIWYQERGIPFRRGYLLYGAPGSGKTSLIQSLAGELGLDVFVISLSRMGLDDNGLNELFSVLPGKCIALMEDIDAAFHRGLLRDTVSETQSPGQDKHPNEIEQRHKEENKDSRITLSGLLNALDGVGAQEGRILFATTNRYDSLDPALCRPGRMDLHIEFKLASKYQAEELFKYFYLPSDSTTGDVSRKLLGKEGKLMDSSCDSVLSSASSGAEDLIDLGDPLHPFPSLATRFSTAIPERQLSMASLQGYLMTYKTRPTQAATDISGWIERQRNESTLMQVEF